MSNNLPLAQEFAWSLATSLMTCVTLFQSEAAMVRCSPPSSTATRPPSCTNTIPTKDDDKRGGPRAAP